MKHAISPEYVHDLLDTLIHGTRLDFHGHPVPDDVRYRINHRAQRPLPKLAEPDLTLSTREIAVVTGMALGLSNKLIGEKLFVAEDTIKTHARRMFRKLGARDRAHAVAIAARAGLINLETL